MAVCDRIKNRSIELYQKTANHCKFAPVGAFLLYNGYMKIGAFDSGKGGTTVLAAVKKELPDEEYYFIADSKNCPYGNKTKEELLEITSDIVKELEEWGARIVIIACNTATTNCIDDLRARFPRLKFVGTEPAIKLAVESGAKKILVLATPGTVKAERTISLLEQNQKAGQEIDLLACPGLAEAIEHDENVDKVLDGLLNGVDEYDCVVLGCTHYPLIKDKIQRYFPNASLIDGNDGVAKKVKELL